MLGTTDISFSGDIVAAGVFTQPFSGSQTCVGCHSSSVSSCSSSGGLNLTGAAGSIRTRLLSDACDQCTPPESTGLPRVNLNPGQAVNSLILQKPTLQVCHGGFSQAPWSVNGTQYGKLLRWIQQGGMNN